MPPACYFCGQPVALQVYFVRERKSVREAQVCAAHAAALLTAGRAVASGVPDVAGGLARCELEQVHLARDGVNRAVLQECGGTRRLAIELGSCEASTLVRLVSAEPPPRPLTPEAFARLLHSLDGRLEHAAVTGSRRGVYYAVLRVDRQGNRFEIDLRPSDALAVALACEAPIRVAEGLLGDAE